MPYYNAFDVLGVPQNSSLDVCKKAYRTLVKKYHPDINKDPSAIQKFLLIQKAYDVVSGKEKPAMPPPPPPQPQVVVVRYYTSYSGGYGGTSWTINY